MEYRFHQKPGIIKNCRGKKASLSETFIRLNSTIGALKINKLNGSISTANALNFVMKQVLQLHRLHEMSELYGQKIKPNMACKNSEHSKNLNIDVGDTSTSHTL